MLTTPLGLKKAEDTDNADLKVFVSQNMDTLDTLISGKEPSFTKNTAFNKNFGTSSGTVAEGNHSHDYQKHKLTDSTLAISASTDWNNYSNTGFYMGSSLTNETSGGSWRYMQSIKHNDLWNIQIMNDFNATTMGFRGKVNGTWSSWNMLWHSSNFNPSDKLDVSANAVSASKLATSRTIALSGDVSGSVTFDGSGDVTISASVKDNSHDHTTLYSVDDRDVKPNVTGTNRLSSYFASMEGLTGTAGTNYQDLLVLNTYSDTSGGNVNALSFDKSSKAIRHYQAGQGDTTWGSYETLAYLSSNVASASKLATARTIALGGDLSGSATFDGSANISITATVADNSHNHTSLTGVTAITGAYGMIVESHDEWLRIGDNNDHTNGIYMGSNHVRTDGDLSVGSGGSSFKASSSGVTIANKFTIQYNSTEDSLDFVYI